MEHFQDTHHTAYPRRDYRTAVEKRWRELPVNKIQICRGLHDAIHASGYIPAKPSRDEMLAEVWGADTGRAQSELEKQLFIGSLLLERDGELPPEGDAA